MGLLTDVLLPDKKTTKIRIVGNVLFGGFFAYGAIVNQSGYAYFLVACAVLPLTIDLVRIKRIKG